MIRYTLKCDRDHAFESWFQSSAAFDTQVKRKLVTCPICDSTNVEKAIMAPRITKKGRDRTLSEPQQPAATQSEPSSTPLMMTQEQELRAKLKELRDHVTKNADNVGNRFPTEARKMHYGDAEHRAIYGEASAEEAKALSDEGIDVLPLPTLPEDRN